MQAKSPFFSPFKETCIGTGTSPLCLFLISVDRHHTVEVTSFAPKSGAKIKHARFSTRKSCFFTQNGQKFGGTLKNVYLCIVNRNDGFLSAGHKKLAFRPGKIFCLPRAQKGSREWRQREIKTKTKNKTKTVVVGRTRMARMVTTPEVTTTVAVKDLVQAVR